MARMINARLTRPFFFFVLPRSKMQVKHLEQALTELAGPNWKVNLVIRSLSPLPI